MLPQPINIDLASPILFTAHANTSSFSPIWYVLEYP